MKRSGSVCSRRCVLLLVTSLPPSASSTAIPSVGDDDAFGTGRRERSAFAWLLESRPASCDRTDTPSSFAKILADEEVRNTASPTPSLRQPLLGLERRPATAVQDGRVPDFSAETSSRLSNYNSVRLAFSSLLPAQVLTSFSVFPAQPSTVFARRDPSSQPFSSEVLIFSFVVVARRRRQSDQSPPLFAHIQYPTVRSVLPELH